MPLRRFTYQLQDSPLTLWEGLEEYYLGHPALFRPAQLDPNSEALFRRHDVCHVIFGLDTTVADEALADFRTLLSTDVGVRRYLAYYRTTPEPQAIVAQVGWWGVVLAALRALPRLLRALRWRPRLMARWPWDTPEVYFGQTLADLRRAHGIVVV
jgi:hypothetical protein